MAHRIFIVEDHLLLRELVRKFISNEPDFEVSGVATRAEEALDALEGADADLVLVDATLPGMSGIDLVKSLAAQHPDLPCLVYSGHGEAMHVGNALAAGARGYALKGDPAELVRAIRHVLDGELYLSASLQSDP